MNSILSFQYYYTTCVKIEKCKIIYYRLFVQDESALKNASAIVFSEHMKCIDVR